jgi:PAS domain S-box-containing protein
METKQIEKGIRFQPAPGGTTGGDIYWEGIGVPLLLSDGRAAGAIAIARNVSDHMQVESTKKTLASLVESSFDAIIGESLDGTIHSWNSGAEKIFGYSAHDAIGKPVNLIFPSSFMLQMPQIKELVNKGQRIESSQIECMRKNGMRIFVSMTISPIIHLTGNIIGYSTIARDITAQKQAEDALVASEAKYRNLFEYSLEGIGITKGRMFISANKALLSIWGYEDARDFLSISFVDHIHPDDRKFIEERLLKRSRGEWVSPNYEVRIIRKDKEIRILEVSAGQLKIGNETFIQSTYRDITLRKMADEELKRSREQLRSLASHLEKAREAERKEIAYEVHDDLGQALTALKMDVAWLGRKFDKSNINLIERVGSMSELIDETIQKIRRISTQLRPSILDHFGLGAAIEWLAEDFQKRTDISFKITIEPKDLEADELITISLFRICQESFTNITRHAQATTVDVSLILKNGNMELKVIDNGIGLPVENANNINSFGLIGMREKAFVAGGECIITGNIGEGTCVLVNLPYVAKGEYHD